MYGLIHLVWLIQIISKIEMTITLFLMERVPLIISPVYGGGERSINDYSTKEFVPTGCLKKRVMCHT